MLKRHRLFCVLSLLLCAAFAGCVQTIARTEALPTEKPEPMTQNKNCNWELEIKDSFEYMVTENGETLKKTTTVDIFATKKGGTDYFGNYTGKGVITVFNALSPEEDARPVLYGGQVASTKEFKLSFTIDEKTDDLVPEWEFSPVEPRDFDGISTIQYKIQLDKVRGVFKDAEDWPGLAGSPGIEFEDGNEIALLYVDGGYVSLTLEKHWQIPGAFDGTLIGIPTGGTRATARPTATPQGGSFSWVTDPPTTRPTNRLHLITPPFRLPLVTPTAKPTEQPPR